MTLSSSIYFPPKFPELILSRNERTRSWILSSLTSRMRVAFGGTVPSTPFSP